MRKRAREAGTDAAATLGRVSLLRGGGARFFRGEREMRGGKGEELAERRRTTTMTREDAEESSTTARAERPQPNERPREDGG
ncbi:unnamed protein product [Lampetra planeri]